MINESVDSVTEAEDSSLPICGICCRIGCGGNNTCTGCSGSGCDGQLCTKNENGWVESTGCKCEKFICKYEQLLHI